VMFTDPSGMTKSAIVDAWHDSSTFILLNATWIWWDIVGLDVSAYMLGKFMYDNWTSDYYWSEHWISEKLIDTNFYQTQLEIAKKSATENWTYHFSW
jgi:hypothetical protein